MQTAMSYGLYADSHSMAYLKASRLAINRVLLTLDPATSAENIAILHDIKHMLHGTASALTHSINMLVYLHAGLSAQLRADFLQTMAAFIPAHVRQNLQYEMFGGTGLFNSHIYKYAADLQAHRDKIHQDTLTSAVASNNKGKAWDPGYKIPKVTQSSNPPPPPQQNPPPQRGRGGGNPNRGRGRGGSNGAGFQQQQQAPAAPKPRGGNKKRGRGGRGGKGHN